MDVGRYSFTINQILDDVDRVALLQHLVWSSMSWKELVTATDWRCKKHIGVDRILGNSWVILDQSMMIRLRLLLLCHLDECVLL